ncbi:hypothetical protein GBAR_LOCUS21186 [Geodia barretti]|uniref:SAM domain-containing protein n=1 Tax=Geodia barretti TaxID=519541 RepID=A0AA35SXH9_GEOBA|nr:hypothetical protein GBAR_LOCUS21186 [Geodia barretti]
MASEWLTTWLESLSLSEYADLFTRYGYIQRHQFLNVDKNVLKTLGLVKVGHQNRLLRAVAKLQSENSENSPLPITPSSSDPLQPNGIPPTSLNSDPSNHTPSHTHQSPLLTSATLPTHSSPPPVPIRRSNRSTSTLPPSCSSSTTSAPRVIGGLEVPPVVKPRQQSLKRISQDAEEMLPSPSSSATLPPSSSTRSPVKSQSTANCAASHQSWRELGVYDHTHNHAPPGPPKVKPKPTPRTRHVRSSSDQGEVTSAGQKPVPLPRRSSGKKEKTDVVSEGFTPTNEGVQVSQVGGGNSANPWWCESHDTPSQEENSGPPHEQSQVPPDGNDTIADVDIRNLPEVAHREEGQSPPVPRPTASEVVPPALPVKCSPKVQSRNIILPKEEVIFELEDEPIPAPSGTPVTKDQPLRTTETITWPTSLNFASDQTSLPTVASPVLTAKEAKLVTGSSEGETKVVPPPPYQTNVAETQPSKLPTDVVGEATPPPPPPHRTGSVKKPATTPPPLSDKEQDETEMTPPPTPPHRTGSVKRTPEPSVEPPPLP